MYGADELPLIDDQSWFSITMTKTWLMWLLTVTETGSDAVTVPLAAMALAARVCAPLAAE